MTDLFSHNQKQMAPLAHRMRPQNLSEIVGQTHLIGPGRLLTQLSQGSELPSLIFWGPPGCGKTTLAFILAQKKDTFFVPLSAVTAGTKDIKEVVAKARENLHLYGKKTVLFLDEIHRFNKAQQDSLLPHVEDGSIILFGATTENPSFEVISALLSRARVVILKPLETSDLEIVLERALQDKEKGVGNKHLQFEEEAKKFLCETASGDSRFLLNQLETLSQMFPDGTTFTLAHVQEALQKKAMLYDKSGEEHYNIISAFIKSMRGSDPDAALYYLARMLEGGEAPLFIARRMVIFASEDIGNANPYALTLALSAMQALDFVGMPEGWIPLAHAVTYLAASPKSNASYMAYHGALEDVRKHGPLPVPLHLRNAPTKFMKGIGYGKGYQYAHNQENAAVSHHHLPDEIKESRYYDPPGIGAEVDILKWLNRTKG